MATRNPLQAERGLQKALVARVTGRIALAVLAMGAIAYSTARFIEAYGLWRERRWAEWFAVVAGGLYIPIELYELVRRVTWIRFGLLAINVAIVVYLARVLWRTRGPAAHE